MERNETIQFEGLEAVIPSLFYCSGEITVKCDEGCCSFVEITTPMYPEDEKQQRNPKYQKYRYPCYFGWKYQMAVRFTDFMVDHFRRKGVPVKKVVYTGIPHSEFTKAMKS